MFIILQNSLLFLQQLQHCGKKSSEYVGSQFIFVTSEMHSFNLNKPDFPTNIILDNTRLHTRENKLHTVQKYPH